MRLFLSLTLLLAMPSWAAWTAPYTYRYEMAACPDGANPGMCIAAQACAAGSCSGTAPTTGPNDGMMLYGVVSYRLTICAVSGQTLSGAGTMLAYRYDGALELPWVPNAGLNQPVTASGSRCTTFPDFLVVGAQPGRVRFVASGVTVSGGATLDVLLDGYGVLR